MGVSFALGHTIVLQRKFDAEDWLRLIERHNVTTTFAAPTPVRMACNLAQELRDRYDVSSMQRFLANAAPWSWTLKDAYLENFPEDSLFEVYGSTELGVNASRSTDRPNSVSTRSCVPRTSGASRGPVASPPRWWS